MASYKRFSSIIGWIIFAITFIVYVFSVERSGSLWDCGEFILGAYKLQVVHPPGAPLFMLIGRLFASVADLLSTNPSNIAFAVNLMSGMFSALMAMFAGKIVMMLGKLALVGREKEPTMAETYAICGAGLVAGLTAAFCSSIWFSAVEGEVYSMSTFFTVLTFWAAVKWYYLPDNPQSDRWLIFSAFSAGLSIGVHLLSILTFPAIALLYYFKKYKKHNIIGAGLSMIAGIAVIGFIQKIVIVGIPSIWKMFELPMVNSMGLPVHSGLVPAILIVVGIIFAVIKFAHIRGSQNIQLLGMAATFVIIGFSTIGVIVLRANADTPVNMNVPSDAMRLLPYLNREQYGERPILYGQHFDARPVKYDKEERYGLVDGKYEIVDEKNTVVYDGKDKMFFPRVTHSDAARKRLYRDEWGLEKGKPSQSFNMYFLFAYQINWMYWRYFMWNFAGRQNGTQGYTPADKADGNWLSGISFLDESRLFNMDKMPSFMKKHQAYNKYFFIPLFFGLFGLFFHAFRRQKEFFALFVLFLITGIGIIIYSNQPPHEPRERDYVLAGSFVAFSMWVGMAVLAIFSLLRNRIKLGGMPAAFIAGALALSAPVIMGFQNFDDHSRRHHTAARDYASNFLNSVAPNSILFTYGDNDTYPLWYAQEVEGVRRDVRVVNLSLIQVDWYIDKLRAKLNDSPPLKLTIPEEAYRGKKRNQVFFYDFPDDNISDTTPLDIFQEFQFIASPRNLQQGQTIMRSKRMYIPVDRNKAVQSGWASRADTNIVSRIDVNLSNRPGYITKDELAVLDVIISNMYDRPIYFATTCQNEKLLGLNDYMQLEGLALRFLPIKSQSDGSISIYGSGRVAPEIVYDNVMNKWKWGNFDKKELFVDDSFGAAIQSQRMAIMRAAEEFLVDGDKQKAVALTDKFFEAFPDMNFTYDPLISPLISIYVNAGETEKAKTHLRILANNMHEYVQFFESIDPDVIQSSFSFEYSSTMRGISDVLNMARLTDQSFSDEIKSLLGPYDITNQSTPLRN